MNRCTVFSTISSLRHPYFYVYRNLLFMMCTNVDPHCVQAGWEGVRLPRHGRVSPRGKMLSSSKTLIYFSRIGALLFASYAKFQYLHWGCNQCWIWGSASLSFGSWSGLSRWRGSRPDITYHVTKFNFFLIERHLLVSFTNILFIRSFTVSLRIWQMIYLWGLILIRIKIYES